MNAQKIYAVITGDVVGSSKFRAQHENLITTLKTAFKEIEEWKPDSILARFSIYRGDSFQGVLSKPEEALTVSIFIRGALRCWCKAPRRESALDSRISIGIGTIDYLPKGSGTEGEGDAFRRSGLILDEMKGDQRLLISTPWNPINVELEAECSLLDALIDKWSPEQAQALLYYLKGFTQIQIAEELGVSQPAVAYRLKSAGAWAIATLLKRYRKIIDDNTDPGVQND
jgi:hypothetical protein